MQAQEKKQQFNPYKVALFSALGSLAAEMLLYPLDTICTKIVSNTKQYLTLKQGYNMIVSKEGVKGLYRGFSTIVHCSFTPSIIYFFSYEKMNKYCLKRINQIQNEKMKTLCKQTMPLITSSIAEILCFIPYMPFDVVRNRLQINDPNFQYKGCIDGLKQIYKKEGFLRLYKASHIHIITTTFYTGIMFWLYELQRYHLLKNNKQRKQNTLNFLESTVISLISTLISTIIINPLDLILTRYQIIDTNKQKLSTKIIVQDLIKNEGYLAFFKGLSSRITIQSSHVVIWMPIYDHFKGIYGADIYENTLY
ncbi:mitochondrial carrier protein, putative [Ichthyophthirius multifiliis]|uniref:Mitochondrial carrier protein, putative n=1 Tax=Ichthyophthirius multifiliis TaxID=5932 RepID=G0QSF1_ICHMU|nr:mitochondrial carrier protein, putative [Ichthyophthirius multifiliis]EGR31852.1 mitochondrial carrier protein, putative [Ichthyophthirius multifiliis]|eukprot:XP_004035338.1 mitochondrial carrier protein, putative [Ichthyophthirius multifiliis]